MSYLEELLPEFRKGAKIRCKSWSNKDGYIQIDEIKSDWNILNSSDLLASDWEIYQESIDWDYIIKNKCLCWFWDNETPHLKDVGILEGICDYNETYSADNGKNYENCRPIRRDEVTFYEDRKNEHI